MAAASPRDASAPPVKRSMPWVQGAVFGGLVTFATPTAIMLGVLLAPAVVCAVGERGFQRGATQGVALCGIAASLDPLWRLWMEGDRMDAASALLFTPSTVALAWGACALAWALCQILPVVIRTGWEAREMTRAKAIEVQIVQCRAEWDFEE